MCNTGIPEVQPDHPPSVVSINNTDPSLNVSCKFRARPGASITWKWANGSDLDMEVFDTGLREEHEDGKFMVNDMKVFLIGNGPVM